MFADLAQYSRLTAANELQTLDFVSQCFDLFQAHCDQFGAEFVKNTGDGVLILFDGVSNAIEYAVFMQNRLNSFMDGKPLKGRFRMGLHVGEVHHRGGDAFGHAINVAARVQNLAEPGGVCVTQDVYSAVRNAGRWGFRFAGRPALKNMPEPLALYHVVPTNGGEPPEEKEQRIIMVIDGLGVFRGDGEAIALRSAKAQALIGYLALSSNLQDVQDRIAALIWSDRDQQRARRAMANCLQVAEKSIDENGSPLFRRGNFVGLSPSRITVDVVRMLRDLAEGKIDDLLLRRSDWADAILYGLEDTSDLFSAWLSVTRHNWREHVLEALEAMLDRFVIAEPAMRRAASALLVLEPSHERAARCLIRHHAETQNLPAAMRVYENLRDFLRDRYRMAPGPETTALVEALKSPDRGHAQRQQGRRHDGPAPTLGVGKFATRSRKISLVVSGFRSELIANLSKFREFTVVELTEAASEPPPDVDYILKADCADDQDDVQMIVSVTEPASNRIVWSDTFRLSLANWLALQQQLVGKIASTLEVYLSHDRLARQVRKMPHDMSTYDAWLRGEDLLTRWSQEAEDEAERLFERAIAADPDFAPAHASLASVYNTRQFIRPGIENDAGTTARSAELAQRAVALDPLDARNHLVMGWSTAMAGRFEQSEVHYELAAELNPNSPKMLVSAALGLAFMGRGETAIRLLERAMSLTSLFLDYQWSHIAVIRYFAGDLEGAIAAADRSQNGIVDIAGWKAAALYKLRRTRDAREALAALHGSVAAAWAGPAAATQQEVLDWFLSVFPIRRQRDRADLARLKMLR